MGLSWRLSAVLLYCSRCYQLLSLWIKLNSAIRSNERDCTVLSCGSVRFALLWSLEFDIFPGLNILSLVAEKVKAVHLAWLSDDARRLKQFVLLD